MLSLIERAIESIDEHLMLLVPPHTDVPGYFANVDGDLQRGSHLLREMQALRGSIYARDGYVKAHQLTLDGRHETAEDEKSWHVLMGERGRLRSCALYLEHGYTPSFDDLRVKHCPLLTDARWGSKLIGAVESEMARARRDGLLYAEVGGWAIHPERRGTPEGLMFALATYALSRIRGGGIGITTANVAHSCSSILRRFGGASLEHEGIAIPAYFDPRYNTEIELLRFDSRTPSPRYARLIDMVQEKLARIRVFAFAPASAQPVPYTAYASGPLYAA